jgi:hypothetical protein
MSNPANAGNETGILPVGNTVWKIAKKKRERDCWAKDRVLVELLVLEPGVVPVAARTRSGLRKCRVPKAKIVSMTYLTGPRKGTNARNAKSTHGQANFVYGRPGNTVVPDAWDPNPSETCTHGIHVYRTKSEAMRH